MSEPAAQTHVVVRIGDAGGAVIEGTIKGDAGHRAALSAIGARWSRNLMAWYLPRTLLPATRDAKVRHFADLAAAAGTTVTIERPTELLPVEQQRADKADRLEDRAHGLEDTSARRLAESAAAEAIERRISASIPMGQPILVGHHSEGRHRRDLARMEAAFRKSLTTERAGLDAQRRASAILTTLERGQSPITIGNRIERQEAELRTLRRPANSAAGTPTTQARSDAHAERITTLTQSIALDRAALTQLEASGAIVDWSTKVTAGDHVRVCGEWRHVIRANKTTVTVQTDHSWTARAPWREVSAARRVTDGVAVDLRPPHQATMGKASESNDTVAETVSDHCEGVGHGSS